MTLTARTQTIHPLKALNRESAPGRCQARAISAAQRKHMPERLQKQRWQRLQQSRIGQKGFPGYSLNAYASLDQMKQFQPRTLLSDRGRNQETQHREMSREEP